MAKSIIGQALRDIRNFANQTRGILALEEELAKGVEFERLIRDAEVRWQEIDAREKAALDRIAAAQAEHERLTSAAKTDADAIRETGHEAVRKAVAEALDKARVPAQDEYNRILAEADAEVARRLKVADERAGQIMDGAKFERKKILDAAKASVGEANATVDAAKTELAVVNEKINAANAQLAEVMAEIDRLKSKFAA